MRRRERREERRGCLRLNEPCYVMAAGKQALHLTNYFAHKVRKAAERPTEEAPPPIFGGLIVFYINRRTLYL